MAGSGHPCAAAPAARPSGRRALADSDVENQNVRNDRLRCAPRVAALDHRCFSGGFMENPSINLLKYRSFPDLASALRSRIDNILERLQAAVKEALPSADELTFVELRDHLPETLDQLAKAL